MPRLCLPSALVLAAALVAGCGSNTPTGMPMAVLGTYDVQVEANGKTDAGIVMTALIGSNNTVVLEFTAGISSIRCSIAGSTMLTLPRQTIDVDHASGPASGTATGGGTISADGTVDIGIDLVTAGYGTDAGSGAPVHYHITGKKH
jgi:hypothetical protein